MRISDSFQPSDNAVYIVGESRFIADIQSFIPRKEKVLVVGLQGAPAAAAAPVSSPAPAAAATAPQPEKQKKVGRNDPCPCGSGKKYKKCCGKGKV